MENMFKDLQIKINNYEEILGQNDIAIDISGVSKIENEILEIEDKIEKLKENFEEKSKIEQMKATLNIASLESEISLKNMDLEDAKKEANKIYENTMKNYKNKLEARKGDIKGIIKSSEEKLINAIKMKGTHSLILSPDLDEIKGYYQKIITMEKNTLDNTEKELKTLSSLIKAEENKIKSKKDEADNYFYQGTSIAKQSPTSFFGNISAERIAEQQERMNEAFKENERLLKIVDEMKEKLLPIRKQEEKLNIIKDTAIKKIENINSMIEEMIKELIQEELKRRKIVIPDFIECGKYFKVEEELNLGERK